MNHVHAINTPAGVARLLLVAGLLAAGPARADLIGDTVGARLQEFGSGTAVTSQFEPTAIGRKIAV